MIRVTFSNLFYFNTYANTETQRGPLQPALPAPEKGIVSDVRHIIVDPFLFDTPLNLTAHLRKCKSVFKKNIKNLPPD